jgi:hypothetical protein
MGKLRFVLGALEIVLGFLLYQCGLYLMLNLSPTLLDFVRTFIPWIGSSELLGATLQALGGIFAIAGLLSCIAWVASESRSAMRVASPIVSLVADAETPSKMDKCKFCGTSMKTGAVFCPACGRAQT